MCDDPERSLLTQEKLNLKSWGLPRAILEKYAARGIQNMFPWQVECLTCKDVLSGKNLVYSAPTSAGKTMVAEILTIQTVLERKKKVIVILPFISVVREKMLYFQELLASSGVRVAGFMGSHAPAGGLRTVHIAICTIEKANSLINRLLEDQGLDSIGCVVVDELHLLGDPYRGYLLELLLTKLKYMCLRDKSLKIQIVGMSATLPNVSELASWLDAALYTTEFRPIPLTEYLKVDSGIYDATTLTLQYRLKPIVKIKTDPGDVIQLCLEALLQGHSILVFCPTRNWCETCAQQIASEFRRIGYEKGEAGLGIRAQLDGNALGDVLEQLKRCPAGLDKALGRSIAFGVAFHHAGLTMDERDIVEGAFRSSVVRVLVATSTLSSGVNLPARRVLIRCPPQKKTSDILTYRQMVGRAGRLGKDTAGESFLICNGSERVLGEQLVKAELPPVVSSLGDGDLSSSLKRAILEVIASGVVSTAEDVEAYTGCTFLASSSADCSQLGDPLAACVEYLQANEFIRVASDTGKLGPTPLAEACLSASLPPDQGLRLLKELHRARQCFVLESELHVIYQVTPYSVCEQWGQLDWLRVLSLWEDLPVSMKRVGELVGVEERFLVRAVRGTLNFNSCAQKLAVHRRFYTALALQDLVNELPLQQVAVKFDCNKGLLQSLQQSASTFAGMVTQFSRRLGWSNVELLVSQFGARLQFGAQRELLDLLRLDCLTAVQARALYTAGLQGLADLATATPVKVEKALARATPFHSEADDDNQSSDKCRVWLVGRCAASEAQAADILITEARQYLERELGLQSANWGDLNSESNDSCLSELSQIQSPLIPSQPIGQMIKEAKEKIEATTIMEADCQQKQESKGSNSDVVDCKIHSDSVLKVDKAISSPHHSPLNETISNKTVVLEDLNNRNPTVSDACNSIGSVAIPNDSAVLPSVSSLKTPNNDCILGKRKRGSLDLFDSPEQVDNQIDEKHDMYVEMNNIQLNTTLKDAVNQSNKTVVDDTKDKNQFNSDGSQSKSKTKSRIGFSLLSLNDSPSTSGSSSQIDDKSIFFNSPLPFDLDAIARDPLMEELDANFGGESLLEMSSFVAGTQEQRASEMGRDNLLDVNLGDKSWLGISSLISEVIEKKRKLSFSEGSTSKRIKVDPPKMNNDNIDGMFDNELQVSQITSTNTILKPVKISTPTLKDVHVQSSVKNQETTNINSPIINSNVNCNKENGSKDNDFIELNNVKSCELNPESQLLDNDHKDIMSSFELVLSGDEMCDSDFNIDSGLCNILDCNNVQSNENDEFNRISLSFGVSVNIDSKLDALLDVQTTKHDNVQDSLKRQISEGGMWSENGNKDNCESFNMDSKLIALMDEGIDKPVDRINTNMNTITTNRSVITMTSNQPNNDEHESKIFYHQSKHLEESELNLNTQLCNILDCENQVVGVNMLGKNEQERMKSMEIKEIPNLSLDDDTVFGTPVNHHRTISFKDHHMRKDKLPHFFNNISDKPANEDHLVLSNCKHKLNTHQFSEKEIAKDSLQKGILETPVYPNISKVNNFTTRVNTPVDKTNYISLSDKLAPVTSAIVESNKPLISNSLTDSVLNAVFDTSSNLQANDQWDDEVASSQETQTTPHKTLRKRVKNTNSPTVNLNHHEVQVVFVSRSESKTFKKLEDTIRTIRSLALELNVQSVAGGESGGSIGAKITRKRSESSYPCSHEDIAIVEVILCWGDGKVYALPMDQKQYRDSVDLLRVVVSRPDVTVHTWETRRTLRLLLQCCQLRCRTKLCDPTIAEWLFKPHLPTPSLKQLARSLDVSAPQCSLDAGFNAILIWEVAALLRARLKRAALLTAFTDIEMPTQALLAQMEVEGIGWDHSCADLLWSRVEAKMADLQDSLFKLSSRKFNLCSRRDLSKVKSSLRSSSEEKLNEFNTILRNWRVLNSLKTRNMSPLLMLEGERLRGRWETHTLTGRVTMQDPSLQHVPRDITIDGELFSLRSCFPAPKGRVLVSADFCQLELRLLAHFSQDPTLLQTLSQPGDVFTSIAAEWNGIPVHQVSDNARQQAKQLCYGLIYGMGLRTLAEELGVEEAQAEDMVDRFHRTYPGIQSYTASCITQCRERGYVTTLSGRKRFLPDIASHNKATRAQTERQAINTTIQGSAADIAKAAMLRVHTSLQRHRLNVLLVLHLHDELMYEVLEKDIKTFVRILKKEMEGDVSLRVPLPVKVKMGPSWGQLQLID